MLWCILLLAEGHGTPERAITLKTELDHVQGIDVEGSRLWVTDVDRAAKRGRLHLFSLPDGKLIRSVDVTRGTQYHPGGISLYGDSIWVPVAEYRRNGSATIERRDKNTLTLIASFPVDDHIGSVAVRAGEVWTANWDARRFLIFDFAGRLVMDRENPSSVALQDMKFHDGALIGGGLIEKKHGHLVRIDPKTWTFSRQPVGETDRSIPFTQEGFAIHNRKLYLLPEDGPSRLFVFRWTGIH